MLQCNNTLETVRLSEEPILHGHTFHYIALCLAISFGVIAAAISLIQIFLHATHYSKPHEQRHIIRILFMVPVYALVSAFSVGFYSYFVYLNVIRDCYEAFAIASFFSLMCGYVAPDLRSQKDYFRNISEIHSWIPPVKWFKMCCGGDRGCLRLPRSGLTWFNIMWAGIFQYCFFRIVMTLVACITNIFKRFCVESLSPGFAHIWVTIIQAISATIAMFCLVQFYTQVKDYISQHRPLMKVISIKLVVFLCFWQTIILSLLSAGKAIKPSNKVQSPDIKVGIPALLVCLEMAIFSVLHFWSFSYRPYIICADGLPSERAAPIAYQGGVLGWRALLDSMNPWDFVKAFGRGARWIFMGHKNRTQDMSYNLHLGRTRSDQKYNLTEYSSPPPPGAKRIDDQKEKLLRPQPNITVTGVASGSSEALRGTRSFSDYDTTRRSNY